MYSLTIDGHTFTDDEIGSPKLRKAVATKGLPIGEVVIGTFTVSVPPGVPLEGGAYTPFTQRAQADFSAVGMSLGTYFIAKRKKARSYLGANERTALTCYDRLAFSNQDFDMEGGEDTEVSYTEALNYVAQRIGCEVNTPTGLSGYYLKLDRDRTMRDVLALIAGATGTNCFMSHEDVLTFAKPFDPHARYIDIDSADRTEPYLGNVWEPLKVTVYNDNDSFSAGDGDFLHEIKLYNDAACQDMADNVYRSLNGHVYLPFKTKRAKVPLWANLFDNVNVWEYTNHTVDPAVVSKSFITNLSMDYYSDCAYATLCADDVDDVRDEFSWLTDQDKVKKDEKISGNKIGNRYGMKSIGINKGNDSVGAEAATTVTEARFDNAEVTFRDKTDDSKPINGGKLFMDTEQQSINLEMKNLPTVAQDLHGAIKELFEQGTSGGWVRPADWIELPEPADNQITLHVITTADNTDVYTIGATREYEVTATGNVTVDWGDGNIEASGEGQGFADNHTYQFAGQYIITITCTFDCDYYPCLGSNHVTGAKIGGGYKFNSGIINNLDAMKEIYFRTSETDFSMGSLLNYCRSLEIVELPSTVEKIGDYFLNMSVIPNRGKLLFPNLKSVGNYFCMEGRTCFALSLPKLETAGEYFCRNSGLSSVSLPALQSAGRSFCGECYGLEHAEIPETAVLGEYAFEDCNILIR